MADTADWGPSGAIQADAGYTPTRPRLSFVDLILQLWRAKWIMILVALPIFALGLLAAFQMPKTYESGSRLYVRAGDEIRLSTVVGDLGRDTLPDIEQVIQGELELLRSPVVAERTLARFPMQRLYPKLMEAKEKELASSPASEAEAIEFEYFQESVDAFQKQFWAGAAPKNPVVNMAFKHKDPQVAAEVLNAAMASYLNYRAELFGSRPVDKLTTQRKKFEGELLGSEDAIRAFLRANRIGDFDNERSTAQGLYSSISAELLGVQSRASAVDGQLSTTRTQLNSTAAEQDIFVEDSSAQNLRDLEIERNQALVNYTPDSRRVQAIDQRIEDLKAYIEAQDGPAGLTRRGPNPTYQALETSLNNLEAEAESLAGQRVELQRQLTQIEAKLNLFARLEPEWNELQRNRDLLDSNVRILAEREQQEGTIQGIAADDANSVTIMEEARLPLRGSSLKLPVAILALLFAGFTALMAGLLRALTREGFASPRSLQRTTGLPVIGAIGRR
jgi:uncharacterized protein involved in exopolysaccharide biosynthesis